LPEKYLKILAVRTEKYPDFSGCPAGFYITGSSRIMENLHAISLKFIDSKPSYSRSVRVFPVFWEFPPP
jgi:hypothetical protein